MTVEFAIPETHYAESDGLSIAYQVFGSGANDLVFIPGIISHLETNWHYASYARMLRLLATHFRVIVFDKRGQGLSDRFDGAPTLEQRMDDVRAVMHAAHSRKAVLFAYSEGGAMGALFTATYPAMVERLVMFGSMARFSKAPDYPHSPTLERMLQGVANTWGTPAAAPSFAPSRAGDAAFCEEMARYQRQTASPSAIRRLLIANDQIDVRAILPQVRRPTLVIQRRGDLVVRCGNGRYLADHIPDAVYLELPGADHLVAEGDMEAIVDAIDHFADASWVREPEHHGGRFLATVLFTDVVGSTELAAKLGDRDWRDLLQRFHALCRAQLAAHRGLEIDTAGDGYFATFDGPARAILCASAMVRELRSIGICIRAGLHTGEVETTGDKVSGMAVHIGARVMSLADRDEVWVSGTTRDLVAGSGIEFEDRGTHVLKGVPGAWKLSRARMA
ncbi:MAG: adenylate/guanylate cyclase domain-containing protein [Rhodoferax sp.]|nr:adenylate/guanylate cyclase domain-containing protein [Rhodoferax sp.]